MIFYLITLFLQVQITAEPWCSNSTSHLLLSFSAQPLKIHGDRNLMKLVSLFIVLLLTCACLGQKPDFTLTDIVFCSNEPSDRSYEQKMDATYTYGDIIWLYLECFRFEYTESGDGYTSQFDTEMQVYDDTGTSIRKVTQSMDVPSQVKPVYVWFTFWIDTATLRAGTYTVKITVIDKIAGKKALSEGTFTIVG